MIGWKGRKPHTFPRTQTCSEAFEFVGQHVGLLERGGNGKAIKMNIQLRE